jgi:hypothetical protein
MAKNVNSDADPKMNQRDPSKPWNQLRSTSQVSSGTELDECCEGDLTKAVAQNPPGEN